MALLPGMRERRASSGDSAAGTHPGPADAIWDDTLWSAATTLAGDGDGKVEHPRMECFVPR